MNFYIMTLFPDMVMQGLNTSIIGRAAEKGLLTIEAVNIRDYTSAGSDENKSYRAAMTLHSIRETDMFELFSSQVENKKLIEELMGKYVDKEGNALPLKRERKESKHVTDWRNLV